MSEKWTDQHERGTNKKSESRQKLNPWPSQHQVGAISFELWELMESKVISLSSGMAGILHTAGISTIKVIMSVVKFTIFTH